MTRLALLNRDSYVLSLGRPRSIDLSAYADDDYISIAIPDFPAEVDVTKSRFELTSNDNYNFLSGPTDSLVFEDSDSDFSDLPKDVELRFPVNLLSAIDTNKPAWSQTTNYTIGEKVKYNNQIWIAVSANINSTPEPQNNNWALSKGQITGVRFRIVSTEENEEDFDFKVMSIRCVSKDWRYAPLDIDTVSDSLEWPVSPNGDPEYLFEFPESEGSVLNPSGFPLLWKNSPKDFSVSVDFGTGSMTDNKFTLITRRAESSDSLILDFDGYAMGPNEDGLPYMDGIAPEIGPEESIATTFIGFELYWGEENESSVTIFDETYPIDDPLYVLGASRTNDEPSIGLEPNKRYTMTVSVQGETARVQINSFEYGYKGYLIFDSGEIRNQAFKQRIGRFGWTAELNDGDSFIDNIRHRGANFGDLVTKAFNSSTPVAGAQISYTATEPIELFEALGSGPWGGNVNGIIEDGIYAITSEGRISGAQTNSLTIRDWKNTVISFEIKWPNSKVVAFLLGASGNAIEIPLPKRNTYQEWQKVRYKFNERAEQTGEYRLVIAQVSSELPSQWSLRNISVMSRAISWSGRTKPDAWGMAGDQWIPFLETGNTVNGGVLFKEPGEVQIKASTLVGDATINEFQVVPKYAELGRFVWDQVVPQKPRGLVQIAAIPFSDYVYDFGAEELTAVLDFESFVFPPVFEWEFFSEFGSIGTATGQSVRKDFERPGQYSATLYARLSSGRVILADRWSAKLI